MLNAAVTPAPSILWSIPVWSWKRRARFAYFGDGNVEEITNTGRIVRFRHCRDRHQAGDDIVTNTGVVQGSASAAIRLGDGNDTYNGAGGLVNGTVFGEADNDTMIGGASADVFDGGSGANSMSGGGGSDNLSATGNLNVANGDDGADQLFFTGNQNQLFGGTGNDWLGVGGTNNALVGGAGDDLLARRGDANTLAGDDGNDNLSANGAGNYLYGQIGNDYLGVSGNNNVLDGAQGDDHVAATGNGNTLDGGAGNDQLVAGGVHTGDRFVFHPGYGMDSATGFLRHGAGGTDVIDINGFGLNFVTLQPFMAEARRQLLDHARRRHLPHHRRRDQRAIAAQRFYLRSGRRRQRVAPFPRQARARRLRAGLRGGTRPFPRGRARPPAWQAAAAVIPKCSPISRQTAPAS